MKYKEEQDNNKIEEKLKSFIKREYDKKNELENDVAKAQDKI